ncbi:peptidyl-tRNA hydrolase [Kribbella sp. ALI-6-A]|uniref:peptidyl-tRNA hydrolase n=1 Tax=Kribbella sp. ALI-6-A TaxID=1933817 RepID=UPI00097C7D34|nr:peptidyl-tRNA hydrolase [Kribbella sp. ALI-6-A]ONI71430.1 peptidyl-tRNA hydrolase [Kribbella sp. ALI-6-A]
MSDVEYVLTLVAHVEKNERPAQTDALETAARAVLAILADERSIGEGEWAEAMRAWQDARIRKVVRRARGAEWRRASALPGITVRSGEPVEPVEPEEPAGAAQVEEPAGAAQVEEPAGPPPAEVRVFPPVPVDELPKDLAKLQVTGTDLEDGELPAVAPGVPVLWVNPGLEMSTGKTMAQVGHAAHLAWWALSDAARKAWIDDDFRLAVRTASPERWKQLLRSRLPVVQDAGFTEVEPGSRTVVADHPHLH